MKCNVKRVFCSHYLSVACWRMGQKIVIVLFNFGRMVDMSTSLVVFRVDILCIRHQEVRFYRVNFIIKWKFFILWLFSVSGNFRTRRSCFLRLIDLGKTSCEELLTVQMLYRHQLHQVKLSYLTIIFTNSFFINCVLCSYDITDFSFSIPCKVIGKIKYRETTNIWVKFLVYKNLHPVSHLAWKDTALQSV